jgi:hypothetical protein
MRDLEYVLFIILFWTFLEFVQDLAPEFVKPYKVNDKTVNQAFDLKHGKSIRSFLMDKVSNSTFHPVGATSTAFTARF